LQLNLIRIFKGIKHDIKYLSYVSWTISLLDLAFSIRHMSLRSYSYFSYLALITRIALSLFRKFKQRKCNNKKIWLKLLKKMVKTYINLNRVACIVLKLGSVINLAGVLGHWVNGRTTGSLVEPHDWIELNRITQLYHSVLRLNLYKYLTILNRIELMTRQLKNDMKYRF